MSSQNSCEADKLKSLTFNDLDYMTDQMLAETQNCQDVFKNQLAACNDMIRKTDNARSKLEDINRRLHVAKCVQCNIDLSISSAIQLVKTMESWIGALEMVVPPELVTGTVTDCYRQQMYQLAEDVNSSLRNYLKLSEDFLSEVSTKFGCSMNDPIEAIAHILMTHLDMLEQIEVKIEKLRSQSDVAECLKKLVLRKHKLKENPKY